MNVNGNKVLRGLALWPHQRQAIEMIVDYASAHRDGQTDKSALVQMPTGSGKSGVIAVAARCLSNIGCVLVLTPRISLRDQLCRDIKERFFRHIKYTKDKLPKQVTLIEEGQLPDLQGNCADSVYVSTIQKLVSMASKQPQVFRCLATVVSLVLVDEGHYEPAKEWSQVIRQLEAPKVIFTATPYRNDFKVFDIDTAHSYVLSLHKAVEERYLRKVEIVRRPRLQEPQEFASDIIGFYNQVFANTNGGAPRVIIRCDDRASISHLAQAIQQLGKSVIGIHERFRAGGGEPWERKHVPKPEDEDAIFWIHQFKLLEGIDDPRFQVLALYERIKNARALVQQVGRIIRNPTRQRNAKGFLLEHWNGLHEELWQGFQNYDKSIAENGIKAFSLSTGEGLLSELVKLQPKTAYIEGRFRSEFDLKGVSPLKDVQLPLRVSLLSKKSDFDIHKATASVTNFYEDNDRAFEVYRVSANTHVIISVACSNSRFLRNHCFLEADLHVAIIREFTDYVGFYESSGLNPINWEKAGIGHSVDIKRLRRLFQKSSDAKLTSVSLKNSNLGTSVIRSRTISAASIEATIPGFDDYAQVCTTAEGYSADDVVLDPNSTPPDGSGTRPARSKVRRYVGFSRGRVAETSAGYVALCHYLEWLQRLESILNSNTVSLPVLKRYAQETDIPPKPQARSILLDIEEVKEDYLSTIDGTPIDLEDMCVPVGGGKLQFVANAEAVNATVQFDKGPGRYVLESRDLERLFYTNNKALPRSLVDYLNQQQSFRILPEDWKTVYVGGQFYRPRMLVGRSFDKNSYELGRCFVTDNVIGGTSSEKGRRVRRNGAGWQKDSLFGLIDALGAGTGAEAYFGDPDIVVCDDMGKEAADFFLCNSSAEKPGIVLIHAKASAQRHACSASALHVVCSQAVKNLAYLAMFSTEKPANYLSGRWARPWKDPNVGEVKKRIRRGRGDSRTIWKRIQATVNNPMVEKEVWLFLGQTLSKKELEKRLGKQTPPPEALQVAYLLHATMTDVASVGAKLRVFCNP